MKIKNLLRIIFRIFGLYTFLKLLIEFLPQQITFVINSDLYFPFGNENGLYEMWIYMLIVIFLIIAVFYFLIINPDLIINKLKPKEFLNDTINLANISSLTLVKIATLSIGILILFDSIPILLNNLFMYFKVNKIYSAVRGNLDTDKQLLDLALSTTKSILGFIFVVFHNGIGRYIVKNNVVE